MADVSIKVETRADTKGADDAAAALARIERGLDEAGEAAKKTAENTSRLEAVIREVATRGLAMISQFAKDSLNAALENERAVTRLRRVAGEYTDALEAQADAMQVQLGVSGEAVMSMQELALRFEVQPAKVDELTRAVIDYSKATGIEAEGAMRRLLLGLENGGAGLARMGVELKSTGNKAADLGEAVKQLHERWGGAAVTDAKTLEGQVTALKLAFGELQESAGKAALSMAAQGGALTWMQQMTQALNHWTSGEEARTSQAAARAEQEALVRAGLTYEKEILEGMVQAQAASTGLTKDQAEALGRSVDEQRAKVQGLQDWLDAVLEKRKEVAKALPDQPMLGPGYDAALMKASNEARAKRDKEARERLEAEKKAARELVQAEAEGAAAWDEELGRISSERTAKDLQDKADALEATKKSVRDINEAMAEGARQLEAQQAETRSRELQADADHLQAMIDEREKQAERMKAAGARLGVLALDAVGRIIDGERNAKARQTAILASVNERYAADLEYAKKFTGQKSEELGRVAIERLQAGMEASVGAGKFDAMEEIKNLIPAMVSIVLSMIPATAQYAGLVGSAVGVMMRTMHDGGWVGDSPPTAAKERPAMLLQGERVLSHREVSRMGGPGAVDAAALGGGGGGGGAVVTLQVSTLDAASFRDYMSEDGGRGMARAMLGGRGEMSQLIRRLAARR